MAKKSIFEIVETIVKELTPLESEERQRVIQASLTLLGEAPTKIGMPGAGDGLDEVGAAGELPVRLRTWMKQNELSLEQIYQVFHINDDGAEVMRLKFLANLIATRCVTHTFLRALRACSFLETQNLMIRQPVFSARVLAFMTLQII